MHNHNREINNSDIITVKGSFSIHWERDWSGDFNERKQGTVYYHHYCKSLTGTCFIFVFHRPWGLPAAHMEVLLWVMNSFHMLINNIITWHWPFLCFFKYQLIYLSYVNNKDMFLHMEELGFVVHGAKLDYTAGSKTCVHTCTKDPHSSTFAHTTHSHMHKCKAAHPWSLSKIG